MMEGRKRERKGKEMENGEDGIGLDWLGIGDGMGMDGKGHSTPTDHVAMRSQGLLLATCSTTRLDHQFRWQTVWLGRCRSPGKMRRQ
jgi:hypothetical protein